MFAAMPDVAIGGCAVRTFRVEGEVGQGYGRYDAWLNALCAHEHIAREIFVESPLAHPTVMFRRDVACALGGYREVDWPEDYDLWLRAFVAGVRFAKLADVLVHWRDHDTRTSRIDKRYSRHAFLRCKAHYLARGPLLRHRDVIIWGGGPIGKALGRYLRQNGITPVAFVDIDPRKIGRQRGDAPTISPQQLAPYRGMAMIAAVGSLGARDLIRQHAGQLGWREGVDLFCAA
jgi:hypothetical protein